MPTSCSIDFENNPQKVVYTGQLLRGTVKMELTNAKRVHGAYIRIYGEAYCHFSKKNYVGFMVGYTGQEDYFDQTTYLIGGRDGNYHNCKHKIF